MSVVCPIAREMEHGGSKHRAVELCPRNRLGFHSNKNSLGGCLLGTSVCMDSTYLGKSSRAAVMLTQVVTLSVALRSFSQ